MSRIFEPLDTFPTLSRSNYSIIRCCSYSRPVLIFGVRPAASFGRILIQGDTRWARKCQERQIARDHQSAAPDYNWMARVRSIASQFRINFRCDYSMISSLKIFAQIISRHSIFLGPEPQHYTHDRGNSCPNDYSLKSSRSNHWSTLDSTPL